MSFYYTVEFEDREDRRLRYCVVRWDNNSGKTIAKFYSKQAAEKLLSELQVIVDLVDLVDLVDQEQTQELKEFII